MRTAFAVWSACAALFLGLAAYAGRAKQPVGFIAGAPKPAVQDAAGYNRAVARAWTIFAALFELVGLPLLAARQNSPAILFPVLGAAALSVGMMIAYSRIEDQFKEK